MKSSRQQTAMQMWQALPHVLIWGAFLVMCMMFGYGRGSFGILPLLPLIMALSLSWESPSPYLPFSLFATGIIYDLLAGQPLGMSAITWIIAYTLHHRHVQKVDADAAFMSRWVQMIYYLAIYTVFESALAWWLDLNVPSFSTLMMRLLIMALLTPASCWLIITCRRRLYKKLWMFLPSEVKPIS